jgi:outer membrane protein assembly factor BamD (BamD/ComL family)
MMRATRSSRITQACLALVLASGSLTPASAFLGLFKKTDKTKAPDNQELQSQEAAAMVLLREGRAAQSAGDGSKASNIYDSIVKQYRFTNSAAEAAFAKATIVRANGKLDDAFDAFQSFVDRYRQSPRFPDAIQQQYEIAEEAKGGKKQRSLILVPMKLGTEAVIKLYQQIIKNAPYGKFAPLAQFSIGEIYQEKGDKLKATEAFQVIVDNYPSSKEAAEAQFRIGAISNIAANKTQDSSNLVQTRDALQSYVATNPSGDRAGEAQAILSQVDAAEATRSLEVGKFYEKSGKPKAAAIYYNEALKFGTPEASAEARTRLAALAKEFPEDLVDVKANPANNYTAPAAQDLRSRDDYAGPPAPELARLSQKPKMRKENEAFMPIPLQEPELPTRPSGQPAPGSLLPPVIQSGDKPLLLPVPPAPAGAATPPPIPAPPAATPVPASEAKPVK